MSIEFSLELKSLGAHAVCHDIMVLSKDFPKLANQLKVIVLMTVIIIIRFLPVVSLDERPEGLEGNF